MPENLYLIKSWMLNVWNDIFYVWVAQCPPSRSPPVFYLSILIRRSSLLPSFFQHPGFTSTSLQRGLGHSECLCSKLRAMKQPCGHAVTTPSPTGPPSICLWARTSSRTRCLLVLPDVVFYVWANNRSISRMSFGVANQIQTKLFVPNEQHNIVLLPYFSYCVTFKNITVFVLPDLVQQHNKSSTRGEYWWRPCCRLGRLRFPQLWKILSATR